METKVVTRKVEPKHKTEPQERKEESETKREEDYESASEEEAGKYSVFSLLAANQSEEEEEEDLGKPEKRLATARKTTGKRHAEDTLREAKYAKLNNSQLLEEMSGAIQSFKQVGSLMNPSTLRASLKEILNRMLD